MYLYFFLLWSLFIKFYIKFRYSSEPSTDAVATVEHLTRGLTSSSSATHTLEVISSDSEPDHEQDCDSDAIDVSVIEADMDLEELMKQKELLQAEIARAELDTIPSPCVGAGDAKKNGSKVIAAAVVTSKVDDEVILLDDSSEGEVEVKLLQNNKRVVVKRRSKSRERRVVISGGSRNNEVVMKRFNRSRSKERVMSYGGGSRDVENRHSKHERGHNKEVGRWEKIFALAFAFYIKTD